MKKSVPGLMVITCVTSTAVAGIVRFDPSPIVQQPGGNTTLTIDLWLDDAFGGAAIQSLDLRIGSDTVPITGWEYGPSAESAIFIGYPAVADTPRPHTMGGGQGVIGWFQYRDGPTAPFLIGTITVDLSGLAEGDHYLYVGDGPNGDPLDRDSTFLGIQWSNVAIGEEREWISGTGVITNRNGVITAVPEPTALALLGLGVMGFIARHKRA